MNKFLLHLLKYLGSIIILAGIAVLAVAQFKGVLVNTHLFIAGGLFIVGVLAEIIVNKRVM